MHENLPSVAKGYIFILLRRFEAVFGGSIETEDDGDCLGMLGRAARAGWLRYGPDEMLVLIESTLEEAARQEGPINESLLFDRVGTAFGVHSIRRDAACKVRGVLKSLVERGSLVEIDLASSWSLTAR